LSFLEVLAPVHGTVHLSVPGSLHLLVAGFMSSNTPRSIGGSVCSESAVLTEFLVFAVSSSSHTRTLCTLAVQCLLYTLEAV